MIGIFLKLLTDGELLFRELSDKWLWMCVCGGGHSCRGVLRTKCIPTSQHPARSLAHGKWSTTTCWLNKWMNSWYFIVIWFPSLRFCGCCSVTQSCPALCDPMDCSTPGFPVLHLEFAHVHGVDDAIQPSCPLSPPSPLLEPRVVPERDSKKGRWCSVPEPETQGWARNLWWRGNSEAFKIDSHALTLQSGGLCPLMSTPFGALLPPRFSLSLKPPAAFCLLPAPCPSSKPILKVTSLQSLFAVCPGLSL